MDETIWIYTENNMQEFHQKIMFKSTWEIWKIKRQSVLIVCKKGWFENIKYKV